ncbi:MAG: sulfurtransferase [Dehalococcoidia bacterium]|nr:MAG: sulfurtransferase [Dehalococcoidia bacterium]
MVRSLFGKPVAEVTASDAAARQRAGAQIVDVREPDEWQEGHIPGATLIPLGELARRAGELDRSKEVIAVCRSGRRSVTAARLLEQAGFPAVSSLAGGMLAWTTAGLPVRRTVR